MFERRLKIFLALLVAVTAVLVLRAAQVQVWQKEHWRARAADRAKGSQPVETVRGRILDVNGDELAIDRPCIDACVDFRALTHQPDERWVRDTAIERLRSRMRDAYTAAPRARRAEMIATEVAQVLADLKAMWGRLADVSGRSVEEIEATRDDVARKVIMRRKAVLYRNYQLAQRKFEQREPAPQWRRWLIDESANAPSQEDFATITVEEEREAHPILKAITVEVQNDLRKHIERYPGLVLRPGVQRHYPWAEAACHLLGQLSRVQPGDLKNDPNVGKDELRQYYPNDMIGRSGLERLAEPVLRGSRGRIETIDGRPNEAGRVEAVAGGDVRATIDIELQYAIVDMFRSARIVNWAPPPSRGVEEHLEMHGAAVVIDVPTGEVRALVSNPTFNLNEYQERYGQLATDDVNARLLNRATMVARVPGSTVKPVVGLAGIAEGLVRTHDGIECTGFLVINGKRITDGGRCWTESMFGHLGLGMHHQVPGADPHVGTHGNPTGHLTFADAVQRSCNVYFETLGERLTMQGLDKWFDRFGLGRPTGLGIGEKPGSLPSSFDGPAHERRFATWISAIGQGSTTATPIQMANVAATLARGGVWVRPRLIRDGQGLPPPGGPNAGPDRVDLGLPREAVLAAQEGMRRVVNTRAGSAYDAVRRPDLLIAGKTGTAEDRSKLKVKVRDADGDEVRGPDSRPVMRTLEPSSPGKINPEAPWYRGFGPDGTEMKHSWFIGFAPADHPKIAIAVMVEYGGGGASSAGSIAKHVFDDLVRRNYLKPADVPPDATTAAHSEPPEAGEPPVGD